MSLKQERRERFELVLDYQNAVCVRATYRAVARFLDMADGYQLCGLLAHRPKDPRHSFIVNGKSKLPTGYCSDQMHPQLFASDMVIEDEATLGLAIVTWVKRQRASV